MDEDASEDDRTTELSTIAAIFPELAIDPTNPYTATLELPVTPLNPLRVHFLQLTAEPSSAQLVTPPTSVEADQDEGKDAQLTGNNGQGPGETHDLEELPPLKLRITLPQKYPAEEPPKISLLVDPAWLPRRNLDVLAKECVRLWEEMGRDQVVYSYIDFLQQEAESAFGLAESDEPASMRTDIKLALLDYDLKTKRDKFEKETFDCGICLEPKKGKECHRLLACRHVFCIPCLQDFYNNCITEGDVDSVKCLDPDCGKGDATTERSIRRQKRLRTLNPSELLQIPIEQTLVQRYVRLKRKKRLESKKSTIYCPRPWCQAPAWAKRQRKRGSLLDDFSESESEAEVETQPKQDVKPESIPMSQRLAICEDCDLAFCIVCKKGWHGETVICNPRKQMELDAEELATMAYIKRYSTPCPTCSAPAQKTQGCNHMICFKCQTHFCYLCSAYLMPDNPYRHFNDFKSTCFQRLWELEGGDGEGAGHNFHGIGGVDGWEEEFEAQEEEAEAEAEAEGDAVPDGPPQPPVDDDTSDEEPAPDIRRRERAIEIVNFARGARAHRILIPEVEEAREQIPPPAPVPPRPRAQRRRRPRQRNEHGVVGQMPLRPAQRADGRPQVNEEERRAELLRATGAMAAIVLNPNNRVVEDEATGPPEVVLPRAAPGQGRGDGNQPAPARAMGLERFLELAQNDREDEWDSDELDDDIDGNDDDDERDVRVDMNRIDARERGLLGMRRGVGRGMGAL